MALSSISITVNGEAKEVEATTTGVELFADDKDIIAVRLNGELRDLCTPLSDGDAVEPVAIDSEDGLGIMRHSATHVMAQAVQELFPNVKLGVGPIIKDGFYYDFQVDEPFTPDDLKAIEKHMQRIVKSAQSFRRRVVTEEEALKEEADQPFKIELIEDKEAHLDPSTATEVSGKELSFYDNVDRDGNTVWKDLCRGPHLPNTRFIKAFKIERSAAAYWRGSEKNPTMQRIYGTAWATKEDLKAYQTRLEEAAKRDHRKLGAEMDLFSFPEEIGPGLAVFHPKGAAVINAMEDYSREMHRKHHYSFVQTPHITKGGLYTREQMKDELTSLLTFVLNLLKDFGLSDFYLELSTKDPDKYVGSDEIWEEATRTLREVAEASHLDLVADPGGAAFYGPKISVQARDAIGRTWQVSTIQLDFNLPERFQLEYIAKDGTHQRPVMIHRALFGSIERFFAVLLEHYAGAFPAWLAPVQVLGVPVADEFAPHLAGFVKSLEDEMVRCEIDYSDDRFGKKIRNASKSKVPFILIVGEEDMNNNAVSFRFRDGSQLNGVPVDEAREKILAVIKMRAQVNSADDFAAALA